MSKTVIQFPPARMTRETAAYYLDTNLRKIDELRSVGEITGYPDGKYVFFKTAELDAYIDRMKEKA